MALIFESTSQAQDLHCFYTEKVKLKPLEKQTLFVNKPKVLEDKFT